MTRQALLAWNKRLGSSQAPSWSYGLHENILILHSLWHPRVGSQISSQTCNSTNVYTSILWEWIVQNLINPGYKIRHANASTNCSSRLSFFVSALDFFPAKSTIVGIFVILVFQTLRISPYLPSSLNLGTSITSVTSVILHHTSIHVLLYGGFQGFYLL